MIYLLSMKKVKVRYESYVFQNGHIDKMTSEQSGNLSIIDNDVSISFIDNSKNQKELTEFIFKEREISIKRNNYVLHFDLDKMIECGHKTDYGSLMLKTKLKKYFRLSNHFIINYELLIDEESIGSYIVKISYEEMKI